MVQINLIGKKRRDEKGKNWIIISGIAVFVALVLYFLGASLYVVIKLYLIDNELKKVEQESVDISKVISSNKEALNRYILTKYILDQMGLLKKDRFRYKDYLDQISKYMPTKAVLTNVDFAEKGWVTVSVSLPGVISLKEMESNLADVNKLSQGGFVSVYSESVSEDKNGLYSAKLHFGINTNGGK